MKKQLFTILCLIAVAFPVKAHMYEIPNEDGVTIYYNDVSSELGYNAVEVTFRGTWYGSYEDTYTKVVTIPAEVTYGGKTYKVAGIGAQAFYKCFKLTEVTVPEYITYIRDEAFFACYSIQTIRYNAIRCKDLSMQTYAPFSYNMMAYGDYIYEDEDKNYPDYYWSKYNLKDIIIGESVERIPSFMFYGVGGQLVQADYTGKKDEFEYSMAGVDSIVFLGSPKEIGDQAFRASHAMTHITVPESVESIGVAVFADCDTLQAIELPSTMKEIPAYMFANCKQLKSINLPASVERVNYESFLNCKGLNEVSFPEGVTTVGPSAFRGCSHLTQVNFPSTLTFIDGYAFSQCTDLTEITIPEHVSAIGNYGFEDCTNLTTVRLSESVQLIGNFVFAGCRKLSQGTVYAPAKVPSISSNTFQGISNSMNVIVEGDDETWYRLDSNWSRFFEDKTALNPVKMTGNGAPINVMGQSVTPSYKGVVLHNGQKILQQY